MDQKTIEQLKSALENKQVALLTKKIDELVDAIKSAPKTQIVTQVPPTIHVENFEKAPDEVTVKNIGDIEIPESVTVNNLKDIQIPSEVTIKNFPEQKEVQKVEITNQQEIKDTTPFLTKLIKATESVTSVFKDLWASGIELKQNNAKKPLYVVHVDEKGAPIGRQNFQVFGAGGGSSGSVPSQMTTGKATVDNAGTPVQLGAKTTKVKKVTIMAPYTNADYMWIGDATVSSASGIGLPLLQGASIAIEISDLSSIYIDAGSDGDSVNYIALS